MRIFGAVVVIACGSPPTQHPVGGTVVVDRFGPAGHLMQRTRDPRLPAAGAPLDLDQPPFVTRGLGPDGRKVRYYNFDIQNPIPALRYRIVRPGTHEPIAGQDDLVDTLPGDPAYSDFWRFAWVEAAPGFVPGSITSVAQLADRHVELATTAIDCPIVPRGTTGTVRPERVWYRGVALTCLHFGDELVLDDGRVPTSPIYVTFATERGPESGFRTEAATPQTHNVVFSLPGDLDYSPLWQVHVYDRAAFDTVHDANSAAAAPPVADGPLVNCPIVFVEN